jgi:hypothetical protein
MANRHFPWDEIPDAGQTLEEGNYRFKVEALEETVSGAGNLMYKGSFEGVEPKESAGVVKFEYFTIGNADDPDGNQPDTWKKSIGAKRMKQLFKACQIPNSLKTMDEIIANINQLQFDSAIWIKEDEDESSDYYGSKQNKFARYQKAGELQLGPIKSSPSTLAATPVPKPTPPVATPAPPKPANPPAPSAPAPPVVPAPPTAPTAPAAGNAAMLVPCPVCNQQIPAAEFSAHMQTCKG